MLRERAQVIQEPFSFTGGQLGLWVGISAITLCEIFGFLSIGIRNIFFGANKK